MNIETLSLRELVTINEEVSDLIGNKRDKYNEELLFNITEKNKKASSPEEAAANIFEDVKSLKPFINSNYETALTSMCMTLKLNNKSASLSEEDLETFKSPYLKYDDLLDILINKKETITK